MNRHQRRAEASGKRAAGAQSGILRISLGERLARSVAILEQAGEVGMAELMREVGTGTFGLLHADDRSVVVTAADLAVATKPAVVAVIGDDDYRSTGPAGWRSAAVIAAWARCAVIHAAAATADTYREAIRGARRYGRAALI